MSVLVVGSIALDDIKTPVESRDAQLGGSASYAAVSASFFSKPNLVGIVGKDFPEAHLDVFRSRGIDLDGLQIVDGKTFRWSGEYHWDMNNRDTLSVDLNVFESFEPKLPDSYQSCPIFLLANIAPSLQSHVLDQAEHARFVIADTMDLWIDTTKDDLTALIRRVDMLILNDGEARQLTGETSLIKAGNKIRAMGPKYVAVKKGEHGCLLFGENRFFAAPAFPLEDIHDPTGAGDTFAGGVAGFLAKESAGDVTFEHLRKAVVYGSVLASFNVESFSMDRLANLTPQEIEERYHAFRDLSVFDV